jgi:hypothetical protein
MAPERRSAKIWQINYYVIAAISLKYGFVAILAKRHVFSETLESFAPGEAYVRSSKKKSSAENCA